MVVLTALLNCHPLAYNWNKSLDGGCDKIATSFVVIAAIDCAVDIIILLLPIRFVWDLQMPWKIKVGLVGAFMLGWLDVAIGILRVIYNNEVNFNTDWTYTLVKSYFWSIMETGIAITVACLIVMRPVLERVVPSRLISYSFKSRNKTKGTFTSLEDSQVPLHNFAAASANTTAGATVLDPTYPGNDAFAIESNSSPSNINIRKDIVIEEELAGNGPRMPAQQNKAKYTL